jgi:hypothetical protein
VRCDAIALSIIASARRATTTPRFRELFADPLAGTAFCDGANPAPGARPCGTCRPYHRYCPSGCGQRKRRAGWLVLYDLPSAFQPRKVFVCHLQNAATCRRVCSGRAGTHDTEHLIGLRLAVSKGEMTAETLRAPAYQRAGARILPMSGRRIWLAFLWRGVVQPRALAILARRGSVVLARRPSSWTAGWHTARTRLAGSFSEQRRPGRPGPAGRSV